MQIKLITLDICVAVSSFFGIISNLCDNLPQSYLSIGTTGEP